MMTIKRVGQATGSLVLTIIVAMGLLFAWTVATIELIIVAIFKADEPMRCSLHGTKMQFNGNTWACSHCVKAKKEAEVSKLVEEVLASKYPAILTKSVNINKNTYDDAWKNLN
jgi:hypothetical protein